MPNFGFSYYLKLLSLKPKPREAELRSKFLGDGPGYDFHRRMKLAARRLMMGEASFDELISEASQIKPTPERTSYVEGLTRLREWRNETTGEPVSVASKLHTPVLGLFGVSSKPEFGLTERGSTTAYYIWNTKRPQLTVEAVRAALSLLPDLYAEDSSPPDDFAILSLREQEVYLLSGVGLAPSVALLATEDLEDRILKILDEAEEQPTSSDGGIFDQPPAIQLGGIGPEL